MTDADLSKQIDELRDAAARSVNPCLTAQFVAISDVRVRALFLKKLEDGHVFKGMSCPSGLSTSESRYVHFGFDCAIDKVCLVKPAFVVVVNLIDGCVQAIIDPYAGPDRTGVFKQFSGGRGPILGVVNADLRELGDGTLPLAGDGTLPLAGDGTLPLVGDGTLPLRVRGYVLVPVGWRFGNG